ncbi:hypothetical protein MKK84_25500 [Methylobacterium sp. E-065]|uniref:hypothetical protein n=1 Tax=Methylobacterium sp. E-065 TaxID=2836583 RepID=UPI001FB8A342|nr:hypothetical protein [Methylobacterium sp. E-065]MCJ2020743.1 hypothetical protein [Methylobacterium sp. E-065]
MTYTVQQLAAGSYDVLVDGALVAALAREVDRSGVTREWLVELLDETPPAERPAPFTAQSHAFETRAAALAWLGISGVSEGDEEPPREHLAP